MLFRISIYLGIAYITLVLNQLNGQEVNFIPNPSFETTIVKDFSFNSSTWKKCLKSDTPDYFSNNENKPSNMVFDEFIGGTEPRTGNGFIGEFFYRNNPVNNSRNVREFIQAELTNKLIKDSLYEIEFFVCLDEESTVALKRFGVLFSREKLELKQERAIFKLRPQVVLEGAFLDKTDQWMRISATYRARGWEKYFILGNFWPDNKTRTKDISIANSDSKKKKWNLLPGEMVAYYYIDDVALRKAIDTIETQIVHAREDIEIAYTDSLEEEDISFDITKIEKDSVIILKNILFEFDKAELLPISFKELNKLYNLLKENPSIKIDIYGHTDDVGNNDYNLTLSNKRAKAVFDFLINQGIAEIRLNYKGFGKTMPISDNSTDEGRELNRRVEFKITDK